jgi:DNA invertase Pin-like site-specific DNA recombinase
MISTGEIDLIEKVIKRKWVQINWRTGNQKSYIRNGITNDFDSYSEFRDHAILQGIQQGYHSHRPDRTKSYSTDNLVFIPADEHRLITNKERRKLSDDDVRTIRSMAFSGAVSQRKIAKQFKVSQATVWKIVNYKSYKEII